MKHCDAQIKKKRPKPLLYTSTTAFCMNTNKLIDYSKAIILEYGLQGTIDFYQEHEKLL